MLGGAPPATNQLDFRTRLRFRLATTMASFPALRRLQDFWNQASLGLPPTAEPLFLLGERYDFPAPCDAPDAPNAAQAAAAQAAAQAQAEALLADWLSRPWMSYRRDFPPLPGAGGLTSDAGWGCTLRSGQMLLAHALTLRTLGRAWRWRPAGDGGDASGGGAAAQAVAHAGLLRWFADVADAPFGLHALVAAGEPAGVAPGAWVGPHALCGALVAAARRSPLAAPGSLLLRVVAAGGGGAPTLFADDVADDAAADAAAAAAAAAAGAQPPECCGVRLPPLAAAAGEAPWTPVLLLVPLVLGLGRTVNPAYAPQLAAALGLRACCGVVGGRPGSSLFLAGVRGDAALYYDPHALQAAADVAADDVAAAAAAVATYHCDALRHAPLAGMDPSVALGFYAATRAEFRQLVAALAAAAAAAPGAPLLTVAARAPPPPTAAQEEAQAQAEAAQAAADAASGSEEGGEGGEDWTML